MNDDTSSIVPDATLNQHAMSDRAESDGRPSQALAKPKRKGRGGARNIKHGLAGGSLPRGCSWIASLVRQFRKGVEAAVVEARGEVSLYDAACVSTACRWEQHALLAQRWLRREAADLTPDQRLAFSREIGRASAERDRALKALGLDKRPGDDPLADWFANPTYDDARDDDNATADPADRPASAEGEGEPEGGGEGRADG